MKKCLIACLLLILCNFSLTSCGGSTGPAGSTTVQVTLSDYNINASLTTFSIHTLYHFVVTNKGIVNHEFNIMPPMTGEMTPDEVHKSALAYIDVVAPGETKTLDYTFTKDTSNLEFACHIGHHYLLGMHLAIKIA